MMAMSEGSCQQLKILLTEDRTKAQNKLITICEC